MVKKKKIQIPIIPYSFTVLIFKDCEEASKFFGDADLNCTNAGVKYWKGRQYLFLIDDKGFRNSMIIHECNHILNDAFNWIGQRLDADNDELQSYFLQYLFEKVNDFYNSTK